MSDYDLHPEAFLDIDEIAAYIGEDSPEAAHRIVDEIITLSKAWFRFPIVGTAVRTSRAAPCGLFVCAII